MKKLESAINPSDKINYSVGDIVVIYQGRFGHDNIMTIKSIWDFGDWIGVSDTENPLCTHIEAIKRKLSDKELRKIIRAKRQFEWASNYRVIN